MFCSGLDDCDFVRTEPCRNAGFRCFGFTDPTAVEVCLACILQKIFDVLEYDSMESFYMKTV